MSRVSSKTFEKIAEQALGVLLDKYPGALSTRAIAGELARDNEFVLRVMLFLEEKKLVARDARARKWVKWRLSEAAKNHLDGGA